MAIIFDGRIQTVGRLPNGTERIGQYQEAGSPNGISIVQDPLGVYGLVARMEYIKGTPKWTQGWRCEVSVDSPPVGVRRCYFNGVLFADGWVEGYPKTIIYQQHGCDFDATWGRPPVMEISAQGPKNCAYVEIWHRADATVAPANMTNATQTLLWSGYIDFTKWVTFVVDAKWAYDNSGYMWFYLCGKKIGGLSGRMSCYNENPDLGPFHKFGSYVQGGMNPPHSSATYHTGVLIADSLGDITSLTGQAFDVGYPAPIEG